MSAEHVRAVFGPEWVQEEREFLRERLALAEKVILSLRCRLRMFDPSLPHERDGNAWAELEEVA